MVIFVIAMIIVQKIGEFVPEIYDSVTTWSKGMINLLLQLLYMGVIATASIYASGKLLEKKVSL